MQPHSSIQSMVFAYPSGTSSDPVGFVLSHILNTVVATFTAAGRPLPENQYVSVGTTPPVDCEQLVVTWQSLQRGLPRTLGTNSEGIVVEGKHCTFPRTVSTEISLSRCWPSGTGIRPPDNDEVEAAAFGTTTDAWMLYDACLACDMWGLGSTITVEAGNPQGGYVTVTASLSLAVP